MKQEINKEIQIPEGASIEIDGDIVNVKGPKGELKRKFILGKINMKKEGNKIILSAEKATKREKKIAGDKRYSAGYKDIREGCCNTDGRRHTLQPKRDYCRRRRGKKGD